MSSSASFAESVGLGGMVGKSEILMVDIPSSSSPSSGEVDSDMVPRVGRMVTKPERPLLSGLDLILDEDDDEGDYDLESEEDDSLTSPHESLVFNFPLPPSSSAYSSYASSSPEAECDESDLENGMRNQCVQMRMMPQVR